MFTIAVFALALCGSPAAPIDLGPGITLQTYVIGEASPESATVVLVPGLTGCAWGYRHLADGLVAAGCRVVVIEPLGVGASSRPVDADYSLTAQADRLAAVMNRRRTGPSVVVAHGVAGSMALRLAYRHPALVRAVVSIEGGPDENSLTPTVERTLGLVSLAARLGAKRLIRDRFRAGLEAASGDRGWIDGISVRRYFQGSARDIPATVAVLRAMADAVEPELLRANLGRIRCPVLLMLGGAGHEGRPDEEAVELLRSGLGDFRVRSVPGAGHYIFEEQPSVVSDTVLDLLKAISTAGTAGYTSAGATIANASEGGAPCAQ